MKRLILTLLLGMHAVAVIAQTTSEIIGSTFIVENTISVTPIYYPSQENVKINGKDTSIFLKRGTIFSIIGLEKSGKGYVIEKWIYEGDSLLGTKNLAPYYLLPLSEFSKTVPRKGEQGFTFGSLLLPVKLRPGYAKIGEFEFATDVTLSATFGYKWAFTSYRPWYFIPVISSGISVIRVDSLSTYNNKMSSSQDLAGFSISLGILFQFDKIQIGLFMGSDLLSHNSKYEWINQGRPWYSVGLGYQLFSVTGSGARRISQK